MYTIAEKQYGLYITMGSIYAPGEIEQYIREKEKALHKYKNGYSLFVDLRTAIPPNAEDAERLRQSQAKSNNGMIRQALIIHSPVIKSRANQLIISGPIKDRTRIIDASVSPDWENLAMDWILYGTEPYLQNKQNQMKIKSL